MSANVVVKLKNGTEVEHDWGNAYLISAEPNRHGDLLVYRSHENMLVAQVIASYAAGEWVSHTLS